MGKRILQLYVEDDDVLLAKSRNINLSKEFREFLKAKLWLDEGDQGNEAEDKIRFRDMKIAKLINEVDEKRKEIEYLREKVKRVEEEKETLKWH